MKIMIIGNSHSQDTFWLLYGVISYRFSYYGEMATYLGMTGPMALFALAYGANDIILIVLWSLASIEDRSYLSVMICFVLFFMNDIYGYISWRKMEQRQHRCDMV